MLIGYWAICLPPSVNKFFTSSPWTVMKQYDAIIRNIEKKIIIELNSISIRVSILYIFNGMFRFIKDMIKIIIDCSTLDILIKS